MRKEQIIIEQLRYRFTAEEHLQNTSQLVAKLGSKAEMEDNHKAVKANLKEQVESLDAEIGKLIRLSRDGFDMRDVQCRWEYGRPSSGQKTLVRLDTNEDVKTLAMLDHERQEVLKFESPSHVLAGPGSFKDMRVIDMADSDVDHLANRDVDELLKFGWAKGDIDAVFEEHRRRDAEAKPAGPVLVPDQPAATAETAEAPAGGAVVDAEFREVGEGVTAGCDLCDIDVPLAENGHNHVDGTPCPVGMRNAKIANPEQAIDEANTLPSARAMNGGLSITPRRGRGRPRRQDNAPLTADEREALEAAQQQEAEAFEQGAPAEETPEL